MLRTALIVTIIASVLAWAGDFDESSAGFCEFRAVETHFEAGKGYLAQGEIYEAGREFREALKCGSNYGEDFLADLAGHYTGLSREDPEDPGPHRALAVIYFATREYHRAWSHIREVRRLGSTVDPALLEELRSVYEEPTTPVAEASPSGGSD